MSSSKKPYSRYFIILQEDEKGYSVSQDKQISGYAKVETKNDKCKVSYYVQNIKKDKNNCYMILICNKKDCKKIINLGILNIDDNGRADVTYEYSLDNIGGTGIEIDKVGGAAIVKFIGEKVVYLMHGFASSDIPQGFKNYGMINCKKEEMKESEKDIKNDEKDEYKKKEEHKKKDEDVKKEHKKKDEKVGPKKCKDDDYDSETKEKDDDYDDKGKDDDCKCKKVEFDNYEREIDEQIKDERREEEKKLEEMIDENPKGSMGEFFKSAMLGFEEAKNICPNMNKCKWYKIPVEELDTMCNMSNYNKYTIAYYPMLNYFPYIRKHGHYMMGLMYDADGNMKYLVYAIPGTKDKCEQPYGGKSGFVTWITEKIQNEKESEMGYWVMFYDFRNSMIVVPMK